MTLKRTSFSTLATAALMATSSAITYLLCTEKANREIDDLKEQVEKLQAAEREALVTKRISEQMGDIAMEQKLVSDRQRERAEEQSRKADIERGKAELERGFAIKAQGEAVQAAKQADSMRNIAYIQRAKANQHMEEALKARAQADTSFYHSLGRSLAQTAITQTGTQNRELAPLLAYSSYYFTKKYDGNLYQQDIFTALLSNATTAQQPVTHLRGGVRGIVRHHGSFVAISDYGELVAITPHTAPDGQLADFTQRLLIDNKEYDFRQLCIVNNTAYVLDCNGTLIKAPLSGDGSTYTPIFLPKSNLKKDEWKYLIVTAGGNILAAGRHQLCLLDNTGTKIISTKIIDSDITAIGKQGNNVIVFDDTQTATTLEAKDLNVVYTFHYPDNKMHGIVTAYHFITRENMHILGMDNGTLYTYSETSRHRLWYTAHTSPITQIKDYGWCIVTASYDHTVRLWDFNSLKAGNAIVPSKVTYNTWPLAIAADTDRSTLYVGLSSGNIKTLSYSVDQNANETLRNIKREFTPGEWKYYMGQNVPYRTFR